MKLVARMHREVSREALSGVLGIDGLEVAWSSQPRAMWLRGEVMTPKDRRAIRMLPAGEVFQCDEDEGLIPWGQTLPVARLPGGLAWHSLGDWLSLRFPTAAMAGQLSTESSRVRLELARVDEHPVAANLCLTTVAALYRYVDRGACARWANLRFAASGDGRAMVVGEPLLPVPGRAYHLSGGLAFPLGWGLSRPLSIEAVRRCLGLASSEFAVVHEDETFDRLRKDDLLRVSRSAVRLTFERLQMQGALGGAEGEGEREEANL